MTLKPLMLLAAVALILIACNIFSVPNVSISANGEWLAFLVQSDEDSLPRLFVQHSESLELRQIGPEGHTQGGFDWNPTNNEIAFFNLSPTGVGSICVATVDNTNGWLIARINQGQWVERLTFSPDGRNLALQEAPFSRSVVQDMLTAGDFAAGLQAGGISAPVERGYVSWVDLASGHRTFLANYRGTADQFNVIVWSPDGMRLALTGGAAEAQSGMASAVSVFDFARSRVDDFNFQIGEEPKFPLVTALAWLDNDNLLLSGFAAAGSGMEDFQGTAFLARLDTRNGELSEFEISNHYVLALSVSPDQRSMALVQYDHMSKQSFVTLMSADGSESQEIYSAEGLLDQAIWSPDGEYIYISNGNTFALLEGTSPRQIVRVSLDNLAATVTLYSGEVMSSNFSGYGLASTVQTLTPGAPSSDIFSLMVSTPGPTTDPRDSAIGQAGGQLIAGLIFGTPLPSPQPSATPNMTATVDAAFNQALTATVSAQNASIAVTAVASPRSIPCGG